MRWSFAETIAGAAAGAKFGAKLGIAGWFGAIAGTIPCAIIGGLTGDKFDN